MLSFILSALAYIFTSIIYTVMFIYLGGAGNITMQRRGWETLDDGQQMLISIVCGFIPVLRPILLIIYITMLTVNRKDM